MNVLIDTSVWSLALRRDSPDGSLVNEVRQLILGNRARIIGPIRQELLSGIPQRTHFEVLRSKLRAFEDVQLGTSHFETAAEIANACRAKGIAGSHTDFLICAVAKVEKFAIFTTDKDFPRYSKAVGLALFRAPA